MRYFLSKKKAPSKKAPHKKPPSLFKRLGPFPSPRATVGWDDIRGGGRLISHLIKIVQQGPRVDPRLRLDTRRQIDVVGTAAAFGHSPSEFQAHMMARREETRRTALGSFVLAWVFLILWAFETLFFSWQGSRLLAALEFLPFCTALFLYAFRSAWLNWQIRTGRLGSAMEYLTTEEPFWPR